MEDRDAAQIAAQVAVEAVINDPDAYDNETQAAVLHNGVRQEVSNFYLNMLRDVRTGRA